MPFLARITGSTPNVGCNFCWSYDFEEVERMVDGSFERAPRAYWGRAENILECPKGFPVNPVPVNTIVSMEKDLNNDIFRFQHHNSVCW